MVVLAAAVSTVVVVVSMAVVAFIAKNPHSNKSFAPADARVFPLAGMPFYPLCSFKCARSFMK
jgi:hypothetical protein